ncbi:DUF6192 family protein [Streptomyces sp. R11]|uniref:DUF6192 family protein n=1 Tax=Streptomyces sp. R11 TaxID=3238625 RepID=A0AB39NFW4_9ACTN
MRDVLGGRGRLSRLDSVVLSSLPQMGCTKRRNVTAPGVRPHHPEVLGLLRTPAVHSSVDGGYEVTGCQGELAAGQAPRPGPRGWVVRMPEMAARPGTLRRSGQARTGLGRHHEPASSEDRRCRLGDRADALARGCESGREGRPVHGQRCHPVVWPRTMGLSYSTVRDYRLEGASRWPKERRRTDVSRDPGDPGQDPDPAERSEAVNDLPPNPRGGPTRWTHDRHKRLVGWKVDSPGEDPGESGGHPRPGQRRHGSPRP